MIKGLSNITWQSYKQTNYLGITKFRCLVDIEGLYELQNEINEINQLWRDHFLKGDFMTNEKTRNDFMIELRGLIIKQNLLLDFYTYKDEVLKSCN